MKANLKDKTICVYDYGLFLSLAITLAPYFKRVYYFTPWKTAYPKLNDQWIGDGLEDEGVYRINDFWDHIEEYDCVAFPDILDGDLQLELEALDIPVWGSKKGEELEMNRVDTKKWLKKHGFPVYHYEVIKGISAVKKYLEENKGTHFIKIDTFRGTFETFKAKSLIQVNAKFDELARTLGPYQEKVDFIIEDALDDDDVVELAYDGYTIDGQYPDETIFGYEVKGLGYIGTVKKYDKLPDFIKKLNAAIAPEFKKYQYRNFCPPEIRVGKKTEPTMIDWCTRFPSPPSEIYHVIIDNLAEIVYYGAQGKLIQPEYKAKYAMEAVVHSDWAEKEWQEISFPKEIKEWIKLRNFCKVDGRYYIVPYGDGSTTIGAVVAIGDSLDECHKKLKSYADKLDGYRLDIEVDAIDRAYEYIEKGKKLGIEF